MRILVSAVLYFICVFGAGFVMGPIRTLWLEPWLGPLPAVLIEAPVLLAAMIVAARWIVGRVYRTEHPMELATIGGIALVLALLADGAVGVLLRGISLEEQLSRFSTPPGLVYLAMLIAFAAMPMIAAPRRPS